MDNEPQIDIDRQAWRVIPPELEEGLSQQKLSKRKLRSWSLVLQARRIPCRSETQDGELQLLVPFEQYHRACHELRSYEAENRDWPPPPPQEQPQQENTATTIWVLIALGLFHILTQQQSLLFGQHPPDWNALGNAHAGKILDGQWWRLVTALTLHSGGVHLASNIIVGGIFINRICRDLGSGLGWSLVLTSGLLGNLANAMVQNPDHRSIGASTAVFGAVGLLATINMLRYRQQLKKRWPVPVAAALGLLALLGAGGENTDIGAHLFGFSFGIGLGLLAGHFRLGKKLSADRPLKLLLLYALGIAPFCWWLALSS
ncbi:MAG TPA: rhomboid family intramembrane serine protease [Malonomonas sp.]